MRKKVTENTPLSRQVLFSLGKINKCWRWSGDINKTPFSKGKYYEKPSIKMSYVSWYGYQRGIIDIEIKTRIPKRIEQ